MIIKAVAGGGGRGMNVVRRGEDLARLYQTTRATAQAVFKDSAVYIERYLEAPRHTEVQLVCDEPRQRRLLLRARLLGPAPPPEADRGGALDPPRRDEQRRDIGERAVRGALSVGYTGAGTMEFLLDDDGNLDFMEMNARIQVEHPVTEMVTGVDLVQEQIRVAAGEPLSVTQDDVVARAATRSSAASTPRTPSATSRPRPAGSTSTSPPGGPWTRVDSHCYPGWTIAPFYDSLIAKLIVWAPDRPRAIERMERALGEFQIEGRGVKTTIPFHQRVLADERFRSGDVSTDFLEQFLEAEAEAQAAT